MTAPRCRPGDLAVVVGPCLALPELLGRFVIIDRSAREGAPVGDGKKVFLDGAVGPCWIIRSACDGQLLPCLDGSHRVSLVTERPIDDCKLRPIRPDAGDDETLAWARPPEPAHA